MDLGFLSDELSGDKRQDRLQGHHPERKPQHARDGGQCETFNQELAVLRGQVWLPAQGVLRFRQRAT